MQNNKWMLYLDSQASKRSDPTYLRLNIDRATTLYMPLVRKLKFLSKTQKFETLISTLITCTLPLT